MVGMSMCTTMLMNQINNIMGFLSSLILWLYAALCKDMLVKLALCVSRNYAEDATKHLSLTIVSVNHRPTNHLPLSPLSIRATYQLLNPLEIKSDINQQDLTFVDLHFVESE